MLTPEYLESVGDEIGALYEDVVTDILADIADRILHAEDSMTATTEYLNQKLIDIGLQQKYINTKLAELMNTTEEKVEEVMEESTYKSTRKSFEIYRAAGYDATGVDFSKQILKGTNVLKGELKNLTRTTAKMAQDTYIKSLDKAYLQVASGAYSYTQACNNVIKDLINQGIGTITYESGAHRSIESAVRLAVRTSVNQNALACEMDMLNEIEDANLVETSSHLGARPSHTVWQGKVFWLKEKVEGYDNFYEATKYGTGEGLGGYNCKHSFYPYFEEFGQTYFPVDEKENAELYEQTQKQRYHERKMREWDRKIQIQKAAGQDTKTATQWKNHHKQKIEELVKDGKGLLKRNYSAEKGYTSKANSAHSLNSSLAASAKKGIMSLEASAGDLPENLKVQSLSKERKREIIQDGINRKRPIFAYGDLGSYARFIKPKEGYYDVVIHGSAYYMDYFDERIDADTLCAIIAQRPDYKKGTPIRLISCNTGQEDDGVAKYISKKLNVTVLAPDTEVFVYPPIGKISDVQPETESGERDGNWVIFTTKKGDNND